MSKTAKVFLILGGIVFALVLVAIIGIALIVGTVGKPDVPENSVLVLNISGDLPDYDPPDPMATRGRSAAACTQRTSGARSACNAHSYVSGNSPISVA